MGIPNTLKINQTNPPNYVVFNTAFEMIKTDGTSRHMHMISNFNLNNSYINGNDLTLAGAATITMKEGPVKNVPISISILNQGAIRIFVDPVKTENHFDITSLYGTVSAIGVYLSIPNQQ